jgi:hypothetical protein
VTDTSYFPLACAVTSREAAHNADRRTATVVELPTAEPPWTFEVDRKRGLVWWRMGDGREHRLEHPPQFDALLNLCIEQGWKRTFNAVGDAQLALSEPINAA